MFNYFKTQKVVYWMEYIEWFGIIRKLEICSFKKISEEKDE